MVRPVEPSVKLVSGESRGAEPPEIIQNVLGTARQGTTYETGLKLHSIPRAKTFLESESGPSLGSPKKLFKSPHAFCY